MLGASGPSIIMRVRPPQYTYPKKGGHNAATESLSVDVSSLSTSSHPIVLASSLDYRREPILPAHYHLRLQWWKITRGVVVHLLLGLDGDRVLLHVVEER